LEGRVVGGVSVVATVNSAGHDDAHRRWLLLHYADLDGGRVRAQKQGKRLACLSSRRRRPGSQGCAARTGVLARQARRLPYFEIKGVVSVAGGMVGRRVEGVEAMIFVLDFGAVGDDEPDLAEAAHDVLGDLRERMQLAQCAAAAGNGEVSRCFRRRGMEFEYFTARNERGLEFDLCGVDGFAGGGTIFLGE